MAQGTLAADSTPIAPKRRRSFSLLYQAITVAVVLALALGFFVYVSQTGEGTARGTAEAFIAAVQRGDSDAAWALMAVPAATPGADAAALDHAALAAALRVSRPSFPGLTYTAVHNELGVNFLDFNYRAGTTSQRLRLNVEREPGRKHMLVFDAWAVHLQPVLVITTVPSGSGGLDVDGRALQVPYDRPVKVSVLPLQHRLGLVEGGPLQAPAVDLDARGGMQELRVDFKPSLTAAVGAQAQTAVADAIQRCASPLHGADQCLYLGLNGLTGFTLVGSPSLAAIEYQADGSWATQGTYQGIAAYRNYGDRVDRHKAIAESFAARLKLGGSSVKVERLESVQPFGTVSRPAGADDAAALRAVGERMAACARATVFAPPDCPQNPFVLSSESNPVWHLKADPVAGATASWDEHTGLMSVAGTYTMTLDYDDTFLGSTKHVTHDRSDSYAAQLLWDGTKFVVVNIV